VHELSISSAILDTALRHADGRRVTAVQLRVGALRQVVPDSLELYFEIVSRDTPCEGARLELELVAARLACEPCAREWEVQLPAFRCPTCGGADVKVVAGSELEVESIEVNEPEEVAQCIGSR
jgi:hydrogenase nickel incorporation protein HypA/HybF